MKNEAPVLELFEYLPLGFRCEPTATGTRLIAPNPTVARFFYLGAQKHLKQSANNLRSKIEISWHGCDHPLSISPSASAAGGKPNLSTISSYGPSSIQPDASEDAILDFVRGKQAEGLVVTVTSMVSDKCLLVNSLQVSDRGDRWSEDDWVGIDFKKLWIDSIRNRLPGGANYYQDLISRVEVEKHINEFYYQIRRPPLRESPAEIGPLAEYSSSYWYVDRFVSRTPCRIAVSREKAWRIVRPDPAGYTEPDPN